MYNTATKSDEQVVDAAWLRARCLEAGADDVGFVSVSRPEVAGDRADIFSAFPRARTLVSFVCAMNPDAVRSPARSIANLEFHHTGDHADEVARRIIAALRERGFGGVNPAMGFPQEMSRFGGKAWVISHKLVAQAAGLGRMGIHRNVIHPRLGNFILLGTVVTDAPIGEESRPIDYQPCIECKLCVAACPVGAIHDDGRFDLFACMTHNYREFMSGFTDWVETIADSKDRRAYRAQVTDQESVSMWQSLAYGPNYKAAYCMAVCPAGEAVLPPFQRDRAAFTREVVRPLQQKRETVYVVASTDAEEHVRRRFPHKTVKRVSSGVRPQSIEGFLRGLPLTFQPGRAGALAARYHFQLTGDEAVEATVDIRGGKLSVQKGLHGEADLRVTADARAWLAYLRGDRRLLPLVLSRRVRMSGKARLLRDFGRCFRR